MQSDFFKIILKCSFLVLLGTASIGAKYFGAQHSYLSYLLEITSASPVVEPFLGYSTYLKSRDFFEYKIFAEGKLLSSGDHFDKVYSESGAHMRRIALINEARARADGNIKTPSELFFSFYCRELNGYRPDSFFIFKTNFSCAK